MARANEPRRIPVAELLATYQRRLGSWSAAAEAAFDEETQGHDSANENKRATRALSYKACVALYGPVRTYYGGASKRCGSREVYVTRTQRAPAQTDNYIAYRR